MLRNFVFIALTASAACRSHTAVSSPHPINPEVDSVVLVRSQTAFRTGPAYRVRLFRDGDVHLQSQLPSDFGRVVNSRIDPIVARTLLARARALGIDSLPGDLVGKAPYCRVVATDGPTVVIELYGRELQYRFRDYLGCSVTNDESPGRIIRQLRDFEAAFDNAVGTGNGRRFRLAPLRKCFLVPSPRYSYCPA